MRWKTSWVICYDLPVAQKYRRNTGGRNTGKKYSRKLKNAKKPSGLIFWAAFFILITGLFFINRDHIRETLENTQLLDKLSASGYLPATSTPSTTLTPTGAPQPIGQRNGPTGAAEGTAIETMPNTPEPPPRAQETRPAASQTPPAAVVATAAAETTLDQSLYFIRLSDDGEIIRTQVTRRFPVSGTPLLDTMNALIAGPTPEEERRDMISLIPPNARVLNAVIEGTTARINFTEDFQYNTYGMEGFEAQLVQVVWTATEFPNVRDVQILIEGVRLDHLGEAVPIWNPLNRQSF
jgi:spore germination protein GerM